MPSDCRGGTLSTSSSLNSAEGKLCQPSLDSKSLLTAFAADDLSSFCMGALFSARDFTDSIVGLAWIGTPGGNAGLCARKATDSGGAPISFNSAIVTAIIRGSRVNDRVNQLTFAHEIGHAMGSNHDNTFSNGACLGGGSAGAYIMSAYASSGGTQTNNGRFSSCSLGAFTSVLASLTGSSSTANCFKATGSNKCGNGVLDAGEACDPGTDTVCCTDSCTLKAGAACSPSAGGCCTPTCALQGSNVTCLTSTSCRSDVFCDGLTPTCNPSSSRYNKPDNTPCNGNTQVCVGGLCGGSICLTYGLSPCTISGASVFQACLIACSGGRQKKLFFFRFILVVLNSTTCGVLM